MPPRSEQDGRSTGDDPDRAEEPLNERERELRQLVDFVPQHIFVQEGDGGVLYANRAALDYTGLTLQDVQGREDLLTRIVHPDDRQRVHVERQRALSLGAPLENEVRLRRADGQYRSFLTRINPLRDEYGRITRWYTTGTDIEDRKQAEDRIRLIIDTTPALIHSALLDGSLDFFNERWLIFLGLPLEDVQGWRWTATIHPEDRDAFVAEWRAALASGEPFEAESRVRRADGEYRWVLHRKVPLRDAGGTIVKWYGSCIDIEDRKQAEERVRQQERELRQIVELIPHHVAVVTPDGTSLYGNQVMLDYYGLRLEEVTAPVIRRYAHPDDVDAFTAAWQRGFTEAAAWEAEARFRRRDGEHRWFLVRVTPLRDDAGRIVRWYVTGTDIDDRKRAEERIKEDERQLRELVNLSPQALNVLSPDGSRCLYANQRACDQAGYTLEELLAPGWNMRVTHPDDFERLAGEFLEIIRGERSELEIRILCKDRGYRWFLVRYNALRDVQGQILRWYATSTDIDDRKRAEQRMHDENLALREEVDRASMFEEIVGAAPVLKAVLSRVSKVAPTDSTVLITGETGTGKELIARAIHKRSQRSARSFVSVNCAAIPQSLITSELFGHEKGAFTGALQRRRGRFELAEGGTLFLDEVGELPPETQIALLRVLQEREFERVGGDKPIRADVRVIAATNRDLQAAIDAGTFRPDLFYRLNVFPIDIPPLRQRGGDIPVLVEYFIDRYASIAGRRFSSIDKRTMDLLQLYPWPGNIRELQNVIERSVIVCETESFSVDESWLARETPSSRPTSQQVVNKLAAQAEEKALIEAALGKSKGRVSGPRGAAAELGMRPTTLDAKIRSLGINKHRFKTA
jgi:formate hydrogenlyase transcriptional activator